MIALKELHIINVRGKKVCLMKHNMHYAYLFENKC